MDTWQGFDLHRLTRLPREPRRERTDGVDATSDTTRALLASVTAAHADLLGSGDSAAALLAAWIRRPDDPRVCFVLGGRPHFPPAVGARRVLFPPGALAEELPGEALVDLLDSFPYWVPCAARPDALWGPAPAGRDVPRRGSFDRHAAHLRAAYGWLVIARPLPPPDVEPELDALVGDILPLSRGELSQARRVALERKQARHRELSRAQGGGAWQLRVLVGGTQPRQASSTAALLCGAAELDGLPYALTPAGPPTHFDRADGVTFVGSSELVVALTRPPARELPGVRLAQPHTFDVTPESGGPGDLVIGTVRDEVDADVGDLTLSTAALNRHTFVCGATGAGKSQTVRHLLEQATRAGIPWLVVEPAKAEYARMSARIAPLGADLVVLRPGAVEAPPAGLNPFEPAPGFPLQTHADLLRALFLASFQQQEPFPQILAAAIGRCYEEFGWDPALSEPTRPGHQPRYPTLGDLQRVAETVVSEIGYGREVAADVLGFIRVRIASLRLGTTGRFLEGGHPLDFAALLDRNVVLEIEDVGDDADKAFLMGAIVLRLVEHLRIAARDRAGSSLRHLTVVEEAHRLLRRPPGGEGGAAAHAVELFATLLAEIRAYGEGLVIAEQVPSKLIPDVIKNTAVKIVHRLPAADDRQSVGATMNLDDEQSRFLVTLTPGQGAVFSDGMDRPILVRVPDGSATERTGPLRAAPVSEVIGRRSGTCGQSCRQQPCTLREMRTAQHRLADEPPLLVWAELAVLAHLVGRATPVPRPDVLATLTAPSVFAATAPPVPARVLDCAVSHAVDDAVAVRSAALPVDVSPADLAAHVSLTIRQVLAGGRPDCTGDARRYLARVYRWEAVRHALTTDDGTGRHPRSAEWEARFRRPIPGASRAEQAQTVQAWLVAESAAEADRDSVAYGSRRPAALALALGTDVHRALDLLGQFVDAEWAVSTLVAPTD
ncbi:ATP-binding protein [Micromonospora radicis]|uniref:ATP-binding protein n=1 Tax=Micromonospora radicis TaxID=1894971 RepID=A0A418MYI1_9ACTN|nr:ATP-binding protein [Micromonospora radicis]RIV39743.1 ATP-binding protein [Micromonospora radicis]